VVVGGGTTGPIAAIAAARHGASVVLIERFGSLGGTLTLGLNTKPTGPMIGGIPLELWKLARSVGAAGNDYIVQSAVGNSKVGSPCDPEVMKMLLTQLCIDCGVQILFETFVSRPLVEDATIKGVVVESKGGRQFIAAKVVVDCSADGDIAAYAGAPFVMGATATDPSMQPVTMYFTMKNVDVGSLVEWGRTTDDLFARAIPDRREDYAYGLWLTGFTKSLKKFQSDTGIRLERENITVKTAGDLIYVNATRVANVNALSPLAFSAAIVECYRQIDAYVKFLKENIPGFEKASIAQLAPILGVRETRHIQGEYVLTGEDVVSGHSFEDSIAADNAPANAVQSTGSGIDWENLPPYEIPYRCLVPLNVEQLLVAGRCISVDHMAFGRTRNMPACMATGQAAGVAAAIAVSSNRTVRDIEIKAVQKILIDLAMPLHGTDVQV
jgi:hypothetical protein